MKNALKNALLVLLALCLSGTAHAQRPTPTPATVDAAQYRAALERDIARLKEMENLPPRPLAPLLQNRAVDQWIKRDDGAKQLASGDEWARRALKLNANAKREEVRDARRSLEARRDALDAWTTREANGEYFQGADVQTRLNQLEASGEIRTGPSAYEKWLEGVKKWISNAFDRFAKWLAGLFPAPKAPTAPAKPFDPTLIKALFYSTALALLGVILYLIARAIGPHILRWRRPEARRKVQFTGEDAELLQLPPDELLERARAFAAQGAFHEALRHLYIRLLLQLDVRGVWRYDTRRTNWEHISSLQSGPHAQLAAPMSDLTRRFDRVRYGDAPCSQSDWQRFEKDALGVEEGIKG